MLDLGDIVKYRGIETYVVWIDSNGIILSKRKGLPQRYFQRYELELAGEGWICQR